ncbi:MAG: hypothetical protein ACYTG5_21740 [Planctomycetota bacterium]
MIAWLLWFFLAPALLLLEGVLSSGCAAAVDLSLVFCLLFVIYARTSCLPGLLFCTALARSLLVEGSLAAHFLALGLPVAALLPLRGFFYRRSPFWQCAAAAFLAFVVPRLSLFFSDLGGSIPASAAGTLPSLLWSTLLVPPVAFLFSALPPLKSFREVEE